MSLMRFMSMCLSVRQGNGREGMQKERQEAERDRERGWKVGWGHSRTGLESRLRDVDLILEVGRAPEEFPSGAEHNLLSRGFFFFFLKAYLFDSKNVAILKENKHKQEKGDHNL